VFSSFPATNLDAQALCQIDQRGSSIPNLRRISALVRSRRFVDVGRDLDKNGCYPPDLVLFNRDMAREVLPDCGICLLSGLA
jgi:hypothetical protein